MLNVGKTLFATDLDGTLLDESKKVSEKSVEIINNLIADGMMITVATARTPATVTEILKDVHLKIPVVCMGGAALYDLSKGEFLHTEPLCGGIYYDLLKVAKSNGITPFTHCVNDGGIIVYYDDINNAALNRFYMERKDLPLKTYLKKPIDSGKEAIFLMCLDRNDKIDNMYNEIINLDKGKFLYLSKYRDIYEENHSYLEIYSKNASKARGTELLKKLTGAEYTVAFGDNENDAEMLKAADISYAVANASPYVKSIADNVIGDNESDSVALILKKIWREKQCL